MLRSFLVRWARRQAAGVVIGVPISAAFVLILLEVVHPSIPDTVIYGLGVSVFVLVLGLSKMWLYPDVYYD